MFCSTRFVVDATEKKTATEEAWRPKCAAPRLDGDSALFFETFMHVYARIKRWYHTAYRLLKKKHRR